MINKSLLFFVSFLSIFLVMCVSEVKSNTTDPSRSGPVENIIIGGKNDKDAWIIPAIPLDLSIKVNRIKGLDANFIKGADISMLAQIEKSGGKFYDTDGKIKDCLVILKNHGVNWVRLRLWNNPVLTQNIIDGEHLTGVASGDSVGGGNCDIKTVTDLARRAKALGMKLLLDFHYSDFWTDPGKQYTPAAWTNLSSAEMEQAIYDYTKSVLNKLKRNNAGPDMVQIGNELNVGMCWPTGKIVNNNFTGFVSLLKKASLAVRETLPGSKIMIHLANGGDNGLYRWIFDKLQTGNVDYDVIGLSFYPYWHGTISQLSFNMNDMVSRYGKQVVVAETAYAFTTAEGDSCTNVFTPTYPTLGKYEATVQGQATAIHDIMEAVSSVPGNNGLGVFYWEPDWIPVGGAGWVTGQGDGWENQAWWDYNGKALESIWTYRLVSESTGTYIPTIKSIPDINVKTVSGVAPLLPSQIDAVYSDGAARLVTVTWNTIDPSSYTTPGVSFTVEGTVAGTTIMAKANITVSFIINPGFESGNKSGWVISGTGIKNPLSTGSGDVHNGSYSLGYWYGDVFTFNVSQTVTGLPAGTYSVSVWTQGGGGENDLHLFADNGSSVMTGNITNTGWNVWKQMTISNITVGSSGILSIGVSCGSPSGVWGTIDDFDLTRQ